MNTRLLLPPGRLDQVSKAILPLIIGSVLVAVIGGAAFIGRSRPNTEVRRTSSIQATTTQSAEDLHVHLENVREGLVGTSAQIRRSQKNLQALRQNLVHTDLEKVRADAAERALAEAARSLERALEELAIAEKLAKE